jgi:hypothetical protein
VVPLARPFIFPEQIVEELEDRLGNCMDEVLGVVRSSLTAPPPSAAAAAAAGASTTGAELAPAGQPHALEIVDETPATAAHDDIDLDAPLWEHDTNEVEMEYMDGGEGIGIEGDLDVEYDEWIRSRQLLYACKLFFFVFFRGWLTRYYSELNPPLARSDPARALSMAHGGQSQAMLLCSSVIIRSNGIQQFDTYRATGVPIS